MMMMMMETTPRFNVDRVNPPKCCQMVLRIKAVDIYNEQLQKKSKKEASIKRYI